jgi:hypothetical protein
VTTDGAGTGNFAPVLAQSVSHGDAITAMATDPLNNTSEFSACVTASCSGLAVFPATLFAADPGSLFWTGAQDVRWVEGDLAAVGTYATTDGGVLLAATSLDISDDSPAPAAGLYYLVRLLGCGSWQSSANAEPGRDAALP